MKAEQQRYLIVIIAEIYNLQIIGLKHSNLSLTVQQNIKFVKSFFTDTSKDHKSSGAPNEQILLQVSERRSYVISTLLCDLRAYLKR